MNPKDAFIFGFVLAILLVYFLYAILKFYDSVGEARRERNDLRVAITHLTIDKARLEKEIEEITGVEE